MLRRLAGVPRPRDGASGASVVGASIGAVELDGAGWPGTGNGRDPLAARLGATWPHDVWQEHDAWQEEGAVRALDRVETAVTAALRRLRPAEDVDWDGAAAARYRCELEGLVDRLQRAEVQAAVALRACEQHAASVRRHAAMTLAAPPPSWSTGPSGGQGRPLIPGMRDP